METLLSNAFGPLFRLFNPNCKLIPVHPKLKTIECYFTLLRRAYPFIRDKLNTALNRHDCIGQNMLFNLQTLFEFLIPTVPLHSKKRKI